MSFSYDAPPMIMAIPPARLPDKVRNGMPSDDEISQLRQAKKLLSSAEGFQHESEAYSDLLKSGSSLVRLEVLSHAADDIIKLPKPELERVLKGGDDIERRYALLILSRNNETNTSRVSKCDIGNDELAPIWKHACVYALQPSISNLLVLFQFVSDDDLSRASLALNLCATVANAPHRIILNDLIGIWLCSGLPHPELRRSLKKAKEGLGVRQSWGAVKDYDFRKQELVGLLS